MYYATATATATLDGAVRQGFHNLLILYGVTFVSLSVWRWQFLPLLQSSPSPLLLLLQRDILTVASCRWRQDTALCCHFNCNWRVAKNTLHCQCCHILCDKRDCHFNFSCCQGNSARCACSPLACRPSLSHIRLNNIRLNNTFCCGRPPSDHNSWLHA